MKIKGKATWIDLVLYSLIAGMLIGISALAVFLLYDRRRESEAYETNHFQVDDSLKYDGVIAINPPVDLPGFILTSSEGEPLSSSDFQGRFVLLTFGFTHCPDICPLTLSDFQQIQNLLGSEAAKIKFVFVSVDGKRDSPEALSEYFAFRRLVDIIALTGDEELIREMGAPLGLSFEVGEEDTRGGYMVNHSAGSFLLDPEGRWTIRYQFGVPPGRIASDLQALLHL